MRKVMLAALAAVLLAGSFSLAQDGRFDVAVSGSGVFTSSSNSNGVSQSATTGLNVFGTFRFRFRPQHSLIFNYGRAKDSQVFQSGDSFHVPGTIAEYSGAYVFSPFKEGTFEPFFLAGAGWLRFNPNSTWVFFPDLPNNVLNRVQVNVGAVSQTKPAFLYGLGVDYKLPYFTRLALRLQYRGLLYKAPDFNVDSSAGSSVSFFTGARGHMAEPSVGLVFRF